MRGSKAKKIRRAVYRDQSLRQDRKYVMTRYWRSGVNFGKKIMVQTITNAPDSLRARYQKRKRLRKEIK